ncbi:MAG: bifunctional 2-C-methyl-D-erythritol 4-phosphate cytidylyltransferase/2-C-methyl-D-erythritol 2,4-cyclodiphosphate synthase [Hyphomicrobium sp.]|nr:MAG: bifunctional 2-C-methyl-D-erythritol 4-phosphate cytidylyltransferase/2-C-methyl-D-erythritol 2,4-cyclodiphosphate synthase [Hyphomicrobium sp.]PPC99680.1 MAG: bifunctional 2-C-methyl-D-erythritol 4-phosphate cytidylyltransferase/2-C-methyl-D-erythritol 2,4-cyclodiphosphate synthase [Hyphomicrobium sp.]
MRVAAIIVAAGRGSRANPSGGAAVQPKQYAQVGGRAVIAHAIEAFDRHVAITDLIVVIHPDDAAHCADACPPSSKLATPVFGGSTRQGSVLAGLEALTGRLAANDLVLIHDAARPFVDGETISAVIAALSTSQGAVAASPVADTLKQASGSLIVTATIDRAGLWRAQTPQGFHFKSILDAHRLAAEQGLHDFTDDSAIAEWAGLQVKLVLGSEGNTKITTPEDIAMADLRFARGTSTMETRTATGFDVHKFADGDHVWLGGVKIPHSARLDGHSDADVALHALTDALLGTIGDGDIGQHFPPSDPQWKGAASILFLKDAARRVSERGGKIINVDVTILAEAPKVGPHREAMQATIGEALGLTAGRIGIKATTTESLGFTGRREGIAAMATATVQLPSTDAS